MTGHVQTFLSLLAAYLLGAIPFSLLLGRVACGVDIRKHGSGNVGATNLARVCGKIFFLPAFLLDFSKGALPPLLFPRFVDPTIPPHIFEIALASAPVLGHVYSPYLGFKGGKGVATTAGAMTALMPLVTAAAFAIWLVMFAATKTVGIASSAAAVAFPVVFFLFPRRPEPETRILGALCVVLSLLVLFRHRENLRSYFGRRKAGEVSPASHRSEDREKGR